MSTTLLTGVSLGGVLVRGAWNSTPFLGSVFLDRPAGSPSDADRYSPLRETWAKATADEGVLEDCFLVARFSR